MKPLVTAERRWQIAIATAAGVATICGGAGVAYAGGGGGLGSPSPPELSDVADAGTLARATGSKRPSGAGFALERSRVNPETAFFDGQRPIRLRYSFRAQRRLDLVIRVVERGEGGQTVRRWLERDLSPARIHRRRWDGRLQDGDPAPDGAYAFRVGPLGHAGTPAGKLALHDHLFPVAGAHAYGDPFGEPRSGGRVHEGQDLPAACGTPLVASRGGRVQAQGYSDALYGHWVLVDGLATKRDYFYAHLQAPTPLAEGERVHTGEPVGAVGMTGNARSEFCQLHLELWPAGYRNGNPEDPAPLLRAWDEFS